MPQASARREPCGRVPRRAGGASHPREHPPVLEAEQRGWVKGRDECWKGDDEHRCVEDEYTRRIAELQARYRLVPAIGPVAFACDGDPANEVVVTFFRTDPPTLIAEHGDSVSLMYLQPSGSGSRYQGRNETFWEHGGEATVTRGYGASEIRCTKKLDPSEWIDMAGEDLTVARVPWSKLGPLMSRIGTAFALLMVAGLAVVACSRFDVRSVHDPSANFRDLRTYAWLPPEEAAPADQRVQDRYLDRRLRSAVDTELRSKGYSPVGPGQQPDFLLNYRFSTSPASSLQADPDLRFGGAAWMAWPDASAVYSQSYDEGTLYIAVIDPRSKRRIWVGAAEARLVPTMSLDRKAKRVDAAAHSILADFPPR
jgi:hypothetical protein